MICANAGVEPWQRLWQTLRSSCKKRDMSFPQQTVSKWIGHSITVSGRHYANDVPAELFKAVAGITDDAPSENNIKLQHRLQHKPSEAEENQQNAHSAPDEADEQISADFRENLLIPLSRLLARNWRRGESNPICC